jgi:hypothetical protein
MVSHDRKRFAIKVTLKITVKSSTSFEKVKEQGRIRERSLANKLNVTEV